jgi:MFS family permease
MGHLISTLSDIRRAIRGNILFLGIVSFFNDLSSEMIYPLLPVYFTGIVPPAVAAIYIGLMDGIAESTSSILKIYSGKLSDSLGKRKSLALIGYAVSCVARPLMAVAIAGWHVIFLRFLDRVGKGIRTSPRDALISETVSEDIRGLAFSFHRMMDHCGAVLGPVLAIIFLYAYLGRNILWQQGNGMASAEEMQAMRWLFGIALVPGIVATFVLWRWVRDVENKDIPEDSDSDIQSPGLSGRMPSGFYIFLAAVILFTLGNSSDLFLVFYIQTHFDLGLGWIIALWILLHISKIIFSLPGGRFSDRVGRRHAIVIGWLIYIVIYASMPFALQTWVACVLLVVYGAYYGMTEGSERALVADFVPAALRGRAYGLYHGAIGLAALPASLLFGVFWAMLGPLTAFLIGASLALAALVVLVLFLSSGKSVSRVINEMK